MPTLQSLPVLHSKPTPRRLWLTATLIVLLAGCGKDLPPIVATLERSPDGGEIWSAAEMEGDWFAIGPSGFFRSSDHGGQWQRVGPSPVEESWTRQVELIAGRSRIFLLPSSGVSDQLYRSDDAGRTWIDQKLPHLYLLSGIAALGDTLLAADDSGAVRRSLDGGVTWPDTVVRVTSQWETVFTLLRTRRGVYLTDGVRALWSRDGTAWSEVPGPLSAVGVSPRDRSSDYLSAAEGDTVFWLGENHLLRSEDGGITWQVFSAEFENYYSGASLFVAGGVPWLMERPEIGQTVVEVPGLAAEREFKVNACGYLPGGNVNCIPPEWDTREIRFLSGRMVISTAQGLYRSADASAELLPAARGIPAAVLSVARVDRATVARTTGGVFFRRDNAATWEPLAIDAEITAIASVPGALLATTDSRVFRCDSLPRGCVHLPLPGQEEETISSTIIPVDTTFAPERWSLYRGTIVVGGKAPMVVAHERGANATQVLRWNGHRWERVGNGWSYDNAASAHLLDSALYVLRSAILPTVEVTTDWGRTWISAPGFGSQNLPAALALSHNSAFVGTSSGNVAEVRLLGDSIVVQKRAGNGIPEGITHLWVDPEHPHVQVATTDWGLFWSDDGGMTFREAPIDPGAGRVKVTGLFDTGDWRLLATERGLYRLNDHIPRVGLLGRSVATLRRWHERHHDAPWYGPLLAAVGVAGSYAAGLLALLLMTWKRGSAALGRTRLRRVMRRVLLEAPGLARRALFLGYSRRLRADRIVQQAGDHFFGLPAEDPEGLPILPEEGGRTLVQRLSEAMGPQKPLLVLGSGGAGKTTLLGRLAWLGLHDCLPDSLRGYRPILVPASYYQGNLANAIADVLRERYGVDVTGETLAPQLETGAFLVLFDGASEIEAPEKERAIDELLRQAGNADFVRCRFVIASRPMVGHAPAASALRLLPLSPSVVSLLLPSYRLGPTREARVRRQLAAFGSAFIAPLLFSMAVEDADAESADWSRAALYERYFRRLLRAEGEGGRLQWAGWRMALGRLASWSLLETGLRGVGLLHQDLVTRLQQPDPGSDDLNVPQQLVQFFDVALPEHGGALQVVKQLSSAGLLAGGPPQRWRFAHDTFEEFFAAAYMVDVIEATGAWPNVEAWRSREERRIEFREVLSFAREMSQRGLFPGTIEGYPPEWLSGSDD